MKKQTIKSINFVLDETGSMLICKEATISGFNEYIDTLKNDKKVKYTMTLTRFNSAKIHIDYVNKRLEDVPQLTEDTYKPDNLTPLYDAIGQTISKVEKEKVSPKDVLFVIMTDGQENASKEYEQKTIFSLIKEKTSKGWTFAFLGANQDAYVEAGRIGVLAGNAVLYSKKDTRQTFARAANATSSWASNSGRRTNFWSK
jgi:hypothetical protein